MYNYINRVNSIKHIIMLTVQSRKHINYICYVIILTALIILAV